MTTQDELIVVYGEALVDLFKNASVVGGAPFNVARHIAGLNQQPLFISAIGEDEPGHMIKQDVEKFNLSAQGLQLTKAKRTGTVQVHENAQGHEFEIMSDCAYDLIEASTALDCLAQQLATINPASTATSFLYHGSLGLRAEASRHTFEQVKKTLADKTDLSVYLDLNWREGHVDQAVARQIIQSVKILKVSIEELQMIQPWFSMHDIAKHVLPLKGEVNHSISVLMSQINSELLLVTYGDLGSAAFASNGRCLCAIPVTNRIEVVDTVGAGDAFSSVMLIALLQKWPLELALTRANQFASRICAIRGAIPQSLDFYDEFNQAWQGEASTVKARSHV